jgi:hypothetical protein
VRFVDEAHAALAEFRENFVFPAEYGSVRELLHGSQCGAVIRAHIKRRRGKRLTDGTNLHSRTELTEKMRADYSMRNVVQFAAPASHIAAGQKAPPVFASQNVLIRGPGLSRAAKELFLPHQKDGPVGVRLDE